MESENSMRASRLRPPSQITSPGRISKALTEMSEFDSNARSKPSMLPPPQVNALKRSITTAFEPDAERKTLVERAGESLKSITATPAARPTVKGTSLQATGLRKPLVNSRNTSFSSSTTSRSTSHSRTASNSSFASSLGAGTRQISAAHGRSQTALGFNKSQIGRAPKLKRPVTSMALSVGEEDEEEGHSPRTAKRKAWDTEARLGDMEAKFEALKSQITETNGARDGLEETLTNCRVKIAELEALRTQLQSTNVTLQAELDASKLRNSALTTTLDDERRARNDFEDDMRRRHRNMCEDLHRKLSDEKDRLINEHRDEIREFERRKNSEQEEEKSALLRELQQVKAQIAAGNENTEIEREKKDREMEKLRLELENLQGELQRERALKKNLQHNMVESSTTISTLENSVRSLRAQIDFLESDSMSQSQRFEDMEARLQAALASAKESKEKLMKEESIRRSLFNQVQELKGNIRVMCRVRPTFGQEGPEDSASISFPDSQKESKELEIFGPAEKSSLGKETRKLNAFSFDRIFGQAAKNEEIFEEISQLVQSALDGYNVCIFCYGQTGAGKTFTMSSADGMIPRAVKQIYETATKLQEKNWKYKMEGSFIEVYNEDLHDLLGNPKEFDKKKHEIRHDTQRKQTTVTDLTTVELDSPDRVEMILSKAMANRSVAATLSNERSSRSHSVFILKLRGTNTTTGETSEGTLNLVDLAGSERLKQSGAEGARMKETQNINKSLSCLGDVIGALGNGKEGSHVPYRNSKLTYLLQYSLGGNSKTLMFVMISPLQAHLNETLTSLKFATKVHNTHIGTAKKSTRMRERSSEP